MLKVIPALFHEGHTGTFFGSTDRVLPDDVAIFSKNDTGGSSRFRVERKPGPVTESQIVRLSVVLLDTSRAT